MGNPFGGQLAVTLIKPAGVAQGAESQSIEQPEADGRHDKHIVGGDMRVVIAQEGFPVLCALALMMNPRKLMLPQHGAYPDLLMASAFSRIRLKVLTGSWLLGSSPSSGRICRLLDHCFLHHLLGQISLFALSRIVHAVTPR